MNPIRKGLVVAIVLLLVGMSIPSTGRLMSDDNTPPVTTHSLSPEMPNGENGWYVSDVKVTLNATDDMSGVNSTHYRLNGGNWKIYSEPFVIVNDGEYNIEYYSVDNVGNKEEVKSVEVMIDQTPPDIGDLLWNLNELDLVFELICGDDTSGVERVEFYVDEELRFIDYEEPYQWIPENPDIFWIKVVVYDNAGNSDYDWAPYSTPNFYHIVGIILPPKFSNTCVRFRCVIGLYKETITSPSGPGSKWMPIIGLKFTFLLNRYIGKIGKFYVNAIFNNGLY